MTGQDHYFNSPEGDFHYLDWGGKGPLTHIAHATGLCAGAYDKIAKGLRLHFHIVGLDFRGHGRTDIAANPKHLNNWNVFYRDLEHFINYLEQPIIAIGHSMGGTVGLRLAVQRPEMFTALVLIEPGLMPPAWRPWVYLAQKTGLWRYIPLVTRASKRKSIWPDKNSLIMDLKGKGPFKNWQDGFFEDFMTDGIRVTEHGTINLSCNPAWEGRCLAMAPWDIWRYVSMIKIPTLLLYGQQSTTFLKSVAQKFRKMVPHAVIERFDNTGHFIPMERPDRTVKIILDFLRENNKTQSEMISFRKGETSMEG